jgi:hypothetical protein
LPTPNAAGWERTNIAVTLSATPASGGLPVQSLTYSATGAQTIASATVQGSTATVPITAEGSTTLSYFATDQTGTQEQPKMLTVRIDTAAPAVSFGAPNPAPNANGWNTTDVSIPFTASDALSGVASTTPASSPLVLTGEGAAVTGTVQVTDIAGNTATSTSPAVKIDRTPPVTTAAPNPAPNAAGWNSTTVLVTLTATDTLAGVEHTEYALEGAGWTAYAGSIAVTSDGVHTLQYRSIDKAGNVETAQQLAVRIDTTPPEALIQLDPTKQDLLVFGKDAGSGVPAGPVAPSSIAPTSWNPDDDAVDAKPDGGDHSAELRTYTITDPAGNTTTLVIKVQVPGPHGHQLKARLVSIQYGSTPAVTFGSNSEEFHWDLAKDGTLAKLEQQVRIGTGHEQQAVEAHFEAGQGQTVIRVKSPRPQPGIQKPGLDLLQIVTAKGQFSISY